MLVHDVGHSSLDGAPNAIRKTVRTIPVQEPACIDHLNRGQGVLRKPSSDY
jgi:hypothetical protein